MGRLHRDGDRDAIQHRNTPVRGRDIDGPPATELAVEPSLMRLQRLAGNRAVAGLLGGPIGRVGGMGTRRAGPAYRHAAESGETDAPTAEAVPSDTEEATPLDTPTTQPPLPTSSFTKVGPPTKKSYTVSGTLRQAADAVGARTEAGATITTPDLNAADNGTRMTHAQVTAKQEVELPDWSDRGSATANQQAEWDRFKTAITAHEDGHVAIDVKAFAGAHTKILTKPTVAESNAEFDRIVAQATTDNDTYDTGNDHGRNAGTTINPNIDEVTKVP